MPGLTVAEPPSTTVTVRDASSRYNPKRPMSARIHLTA